MMDKFQNKYRIPSARLQNWDYRWAGAYFITICTQNRIHYFGVIKNGKMQLSQIGVIADILWYQIPYHAQNVELGAFVVMPNHIHGILIINDNNNVQTLHDTPLSQTNVQTLHDTPIKTNNNNNVQTLHDTPIKTNNNNNVQTLHATSLPQTNVQMGNISPKSNSVSAIIRSYKSAVTFHAHRLGFDFQWQSRFYDHIVRNDESFQRITNYIIINPAKWQEDKFFNAK